MPEKRTGWRRAFVLAICQLMVVGTAEMYVDVYVPKKYFAFRLAVRMLNQLSITIFASVLVARFLPNSRRKPPVTPKPTKEPDQEGESWPPAPKVPPAE